MPNKQIPQERDRSSWPNEEREEDTDAGDSEEDLTLSEEERLARQCASHEARRKRAKTAIKKGLVIVNTGMGKGKTTAAMGLLLRAWGQGLRVCMLQFIKARTANWGEEKAARKIGIEMIPLGAGFTWLSDNIEVTIQVPLQSRLRGCFIFRKALHDTAIMCLSSPFRGGLKDSRVPE